MRNLLFLCLFSLGHNLLAQNDYIVTIKGDTLAGTVSFSNIEGSVERLWLEEEGAKRKMYTALQVRMAHKDSFDYMIIRHIGYQFMQVVKRGYVNLLKFRAENSSTFSTSLLYKLDGTKTEVPKLNFRKPMASFFAECDDVSTRIRNKELAFRDLNRILDLYNTCITKQTGAQPPAAEATVAVPAASVTEPAVEPTPPPAPESSPALEIIQQLKTTYAAQGSPEGDFNPIVSDIEKKLGSNDPVPSYLLNALKSSVDGNSELITLIDQLAATLKQP